MEHDFVSALILLLIVMDPLGNVPVVLSLLSQVPVSRRLHVISRECLLAGVLLLMFMWAGRPLLQAMRLSDAALQIAGGLILLLIALGMAFPGASRLRHSPSDEGEPMLVPLAIPLIAGPSSLATVLLLSSRQPEQDWVWAAAIVLSVALVWLVLALAQPLSQRLGRPVLTAMERLMGLLLSAMAIEMLITGLRHAFPASMS